MSLWNAISGWFAHKADQNIYMPIPYDHVKNPNYSPDPITAGQHYFRILLAEMSLKHDRAWFASWYPAVHSLVRFRFGDQTIDVPYIAGSQALQGINAANLDKVIQMNHPLTCLMPFNGGDIDIFAGLLAMQGENYLDRFIDVLHNFSNLLTIPQLSSVLNVATPLIDGVKNLLGIGNGTMHLGFQQVFSKASGNLHPGYIAIVRATEQEVSPDQLWIVNSRLRIGPSLDDNQPFSGHSYMLLHIVSQEERDDWEALTSIQDPLYAAIDALYNDRPHEAQSYLRQAITAAWKSPDLTSAHRKAVIYRLKEQFKEWQNLGLGAVQPDLANLNMVMAGALPAATALKAEEPDLEEMFAST